MKLFEWEGKKLLEEKGIRVPAGVLCHSQMEAKKAVKAMGNAFLKAQVLSGGRGKKGLVLEANESNAERLAEKLFKESRLVLVEKAIKAKKELFLGFTVNPEKKGIDALFSASGGTEVESAREMKRVLVGLKQGFGKKEAAELFDGKGIGRNEAKELQGIAVKLFKAMAELDLELIEVNPLFLTEQGKLIAGDVKIVVDENALFRQKFKAREKKNSMEARAREQGISFVEMDGNIAVIGCGAGMVMASIDLIELKGGRAASFCDIGGGADAKRVKKGLELATENKRVKGVFLNIFGGITRCNEIADGIIEFSEKTRARIPLAVRMIGTNEKQGRQALEKKGIKVSGSMEKGIKEIIERGK